MMEDVDAVGITEDRESKQEGEKKRPCLVTLSGLLNAIGESGLQNHRPLQEIG